MHSLEVLDALSADGEVFLDAVDACTDLSEIARGGVSHCMGRSDKVERVL